MADEEKLHKKNIIELLMIKSGNVTIKALLERGYFPKELPPIFTSTSFSETVMSNMADFTADMSKSSYQSGHYNLARPGGLRRKLSLVHPVAQVRLILNIHEIHAEINNIYTLSNISETKPKLGNGDKERGYTFTSDFSDRARMRVDEGVLSKYVLKADISSLYNSIYTHSIPWALHGKETAKKNRYSKDYAGNKLDRLIRNTIYGQTNGIPIGPDTSLIISELILCRIDEELQQLHPNITAFRFVDDYEIYVKSREEGEDILNNLQKILNKYELELNSRKTEILELPQEYSESWVKELVLPKKSASGKVEDADLISFFDSIFKTSKSHPSNSVVAYGLSMLSKSDIKLYNQDLLLKLLCQSVTVENGCIDRFANVLQALKLDSEALSMLREVLEDHILFHRRWGHDSEVAWALWLMHHYKIEVSQHVFCKLQDPTDPITAILTLQLYKGGKISEKFDTSKFEDLLSVEELNGEYWLLVYENCIQRWLEKEIELPKAFEILRDKNVSFLKLDAKVKDERIESHLHFY